MMTSTVANEPGSILVVDDNLANLKTLEALLSSTGYQVRCAPNVRTAFMIIESSCPELILLDIRMPDMDGFEVCRRLKDTEQTRAVPIIFISAADEVKDKVKGFEVGAVDYIEKPIQAAEVLARVKNHLQLFRLQKALIKSYDEVDQKVRERTFELEVTSESLHLVAAQLKEKTAHLEEAQRIAHLGSWEYFVETEQLVCSAETERLFGGIDGDLKTAMTRLHPEDLPQVKQTILLALQGPVRREVEFRIVLPDGGIRWLRGQCELCLGDHRPKRLTGTVYDITERMNYQKLVESIDLKLSSLTGQGFFQGLVTEVARTIKADYVLVGEWSPRCPAEVTTLAVTDGVRLLDNFSYSLRGTPCEDVIGERFCCHSGNVQELFPEDALLTEMGINSYIGTPLHNSSGEIQGLLVALYRDALPDVLLIRSILQVVGLRFSSMIEVQKSQRALETSHENYKNISNEFRTLLDGIPDIIGRYTPDLKLIWGNAAAQQYFHRSIDDLVGQYCYDLWHKDKSACDDCSILRCIASGRTEIGLKSTPDGRQWGVKAFPLRGVDGRVESVISIASDITERFKAREEADRSARLASIGELAAGVAHEINNPINGIINYAQLLADGSTESSRENEIAGAIIEEGERVAGIVRALLSFAREQGEEKGDVDLAEMVSQVMNLTLNQLNKDNIAVHFDFPNQLPPVYANRQQLQQVLLNLLSNARFALNEKYPLANPQKRIEISAGPSSNGNDERIWLEVHDFGTGIPRHLLEKVRDPFFTTKPADTGTGLGLSISHGIIEAHGGEMLISSCANEWTKIRVQLPSV